MEKVPDTLFKKVFTCWVNYLGGFFIALMTCLGFAMLMKGPLSKLIIGIIVLFIFCIPASSSLWSWGNRDLNKYSFGHIEKDYFLGFKIGFLASIPSIIVTLFLIPMKLEIIPNFMWLVKVLNAQIWPILNLIEETSYISNLTWLELILMVSLTLIPTVVMGVSYILGFKDFSPMQKMMYKNKKKKK